jgi:hypothetical protein
MNVQAKRICVAGLLIFAVLSATDFVQTYALIKLTGGVVTEANPVAATWLDLFGWSGLAVFKAAAVLVVIGAVAVLASRRPLAGIGVTAAACLTLTCVTMRSHEMVKADEWYHADDPALVEWAPTVIYPSTIIDPAQDPAWQTAEA